MASTRGEKPGRTRPGAVDKPAGAPTPSAPARLHAELVESRSGWKLTVTLSSAAAELIRSGGVGELEGFVTDDRFTLSVAPNLVPGTPFPISSVEVVLN